MSRKIATVLVIMHVPEGIGMGELEDLVTDAMHEDPRIDGANVKVHVELGPMLPARQCSGVTR